MPRKKDYDRAAADALVRAGHGVVRRADLVAVGVPESTLTHLTGSTGPWQRILPGVVLTHRGTPTLTEKRRAALVHGGPGARSGGHHALDLWGVLGRRVDVGEQVPVVVPHERHRTSSGFCVVERSERPTGSTRRQGLPVTGLARSGADACRRQDMSLDDVREVLSAVLRTERCTLRRLEREVRSGPTRRSGFARGALAELGAGARSAAEGEAFRIIATSDLPQPVWNEDVVVGGRQIGEADAWWPELGVVVEIDSMTWHPGARALRRTQAEARRHLAAGIVLVSISPADLLADPRGFPDLLRRTLDAASARRGSGR